MRWLVPNLADFYRTRPDVRIRLSMTSAREIRTEGADLVIAWDLTSYPESDRARAIPLAPWGFVQLPFGLMALPAAGRTLPSNLDEFTSWLRARLEYKDAR